MTALPKLWYDIITVWHEFFFVIFNVLLLHMNKFSQFKCFSKFTAENKCLQVLVQFLSGISGIVLFHNNARMYCFLFMPVLSL